MKSQRQRIQEAKDWEFLKMAADNGDHLAKSLLVRKAEIEASIHIFKERLRSRIEPMTKKDLVEFSDLVKEYQMLIDLFDLDKKKPIIYLKSLKRLKKAKV